MCHCLSDANLNAQESPPASRRWVRPWTYSLQRPLYDVLPEDCIGNPMYFVSHAWSCTLEELVASLTVRMSTSCLFHS